MPTLNYEIKLECENCGNKQVEKVPKGSAFVAYRETLPHKLGYGIESTQSGYYKNYGKAEKMTIKRCTNCRTAMLVREV